MLINIHELFFSFGDRCGSYLTLILLQFCLWSTVSTAMIVVGSLGNWSALSSAPATTFMYSCILTIFVQFLLLVASLCYHHVDALHLAINHCTEYTLDNSLERSAFIFLAFSSESFQPWATSRASGVVYFLYIYIIEEYFKEFLECH